MRKPRHELRPLTVLLALGLFGCELDQRGELDESTFVALNVGIISTLKSSATVHPVRLSAALIKRNEDYEGFSFESQTPGAAIKPALLEGEMNGVLIDVRDKGMLISKLRGSVSTTIYVSRGEFGIVNGDLYFSEGTRIDTDADDYIFQGDRWRIRPPPVEAIVVSVDPNWLEQLEIKPEVLDGALDRARDVFPSSNPAAWPSYVEKAIGLEIATRNNIPIFLGDIAKVELQYIEPSDVGDDSTFILLRAQ